MAGAKQREHFQDKKKDPSRKGSKKDWSYLEFLSVHPSGLFHAETQPIWHSKSPAQVKLVTCYYFIIYYSAQQLPWSAVLGLRVITFSRSYVPFYPHVPEYRRYLRCCLSHTAYWNDFSLRLVTTMPSQPHGLSSYLTSLSVPTGRDGVLFMDLQPMVFYGFHPTIVHISVLHAQVFPHI